VWLGEISYEIFLLHVLVMALLTGVVLKWPLFTGSLPGLYAMTLLITIPLAWALHQLTRRPTCTLSAFWNNAGRSVRVAERPMKPTDPIAGGPR
jgi:peptidoglycan/LPS O-acetylase OafA/YrhL